MADSAHENAGAHVVEPDLNDVQANSDLKMTETNPTWIQSFIVISPLKLMKIIIVYFMRVLLSHLTRI